MESMVQVEHSRVISPADSSVGLWREVLIVALISAVGLAIRFPFFFPAVVDWDESTYIIGGQSAVDGFLPYTIAWYVQPPLGGYWWFGAAIELFGNTIPAVRFAGFLWLVLSAYILYRAAFLISGTRLGAFFGAAMVIAASSAFGTHVCIEHLAELPIAGAILVLFDGDRRPRSIFLGGSLLGLACMFRLNLVYLSFCVGAFLCISSYRRPWQSFLREAVQRAALFTAGVLSPAVLSLLPFLLTGRSQLYIEFYEAAVSYSHEQLSLTENVVALLGVSGGGLVGATMWGSAALGAFMVSSRWRKFNQAQRSNWLLSGVIVLGSSLSIVFTGPAYYHYCAQLVPGLSIFSAAAFLPPAEVALSKTNRIKFAAGCVLIALGIFRMTAAEWNALGQRLRAGVPLSYGIEYDIANFIKRQGSKDLSLFMLDHHLVYWLLGRYPPTPLATHPSHLDLPFLWKILEPDDETSEDALRNVFRRDPCFVVWHPEVWWLDAALSRFVQQELATEYALVGQVQSVQVYRRITRVRAESSALERELPSPRQMSDDLSTVSVRYCGE
jgi:hypothetical protein